MHPKFQDVQQKCQAAKIDDQQTKFRWLVGESGGQLYDLDLATRFTRVRNVTLDSVFFTAGKLNQIKC